MHVIIHETIESQLASGEPPEVAATLERLRRGGIGRHDAIHAIGTVLADEILGMLGEKRLFDRVAYFAGLAELTDDPEAHGIVMRRA